MLKNLTALTLSGIAALAISAQASDAAAQMRVGPQLGYNLDSEDTLIGADAWFGVSNLSENVQLHFSPSLNYYMDSGENITIARLNLDAKFLYQLSGTVQPYGIAGLGVHYVSLDLPDTLGGNSSDTDMGLNIGAGALFMTDSAIQPFTELRIAIHDNTFSELVAGLLFVF